MAVAMSDELFEQLVDRAVTQIPSDLAELVQNCVVVIESRAPEPDGDLLGFYDGVPLSERDSWYSGVLPDRIVIYRDAILDLCDSEGRWSTRCASRCGTRWRTTSASTTIGSTSWATPERSWAARTAPGRASCRFLKRP